MEIVFATNNSNKVREVQQVLGESWHLITPHDLGIDEEIPEEQPTLDGNALQKARYIYDRCGRNCFADDTGLEVDALGGAPGVYSARYAGPAKRPSDNMALLLRNLQGVANRAAHFRTVIALILNGREYLFEGRVEGHIIDTERGGEGFGYDPIFVPEGYTTTFAEMSAEAKNAISHRGRAVARLAEFLTSH